MPDLQFFLSLPCEEYIYGLDDKCSVCTPVNVKNVADKIPITDQLRDA